MKRSEMLDLMMKITRCYRNNLHENSSQYDMYDKILTAMEEAGMAPPTTMRYVESPPGNTLCSEVCAWDKEE